MATLVLVALGVVHLYFLYKVWTEVGFLWCLATLLIPLVGLYLVYREWPLLRGVFFAELVLGVVLFFLPSSQVQ